MSTHNEGHGRKIVDLEYHHSLLPGTTEKVRKHYLKSNYNIVFDRIRDIVRKEENADYQHFLLIP